MTKIFTSIWALVIAFTSLISSRGQAAGQASSFKKAPQEQTIASSPRKGSSSEEKIWCSNYGDLAVLQVYRADEIGARDTFLNFKRSQVLKSSELCKLTFSGKRISAAEGMSFVGRSGDWLLFDDGEETRNEQAFVILSVRSSKIAFRGSRDVGKDIVAITEGKRVGLRFYKVLKADCPVERGDLSCWKKTLTENKVPPTISLAPPQCEIQKPAPKFESDRMGYSVSVAVEVTNILRPGIKYLREEPFCSLSQ